MEDGEIRVNWRAALKPDNDERVVLARAQTVGLKRAVMDIGCELPAGECELALMLPGTSPDAGSSIVKGRARIAVTALAPNKFQIVAHWQHMHHDGEHLLSRHLEMAGQE